MRPRNVAGGRRVYGRDQGLGMYRDRAGALNYKATGPGNPGVRGPGMPGQQLPIRYPREPMPPISIDDMMPFADDPMGPRDVLINRARAPGYNPPIMGPPPRFQTPPGRQPIFIDRFNEPGGGYETPPFAPPNRFDELGGEAPTSPWQPLQPFAAGGGGLQGLDMAALLQLIRAAQQGAAPGGPYRY